MACFSSYIGQSLFLTDCITALAAGPAATGRVGRSVPIHQQSSAHWWFDVASYLHTRTHAHTHTRLTALYPGLPGWVGTRKVKTNLDFTEARDSEWQWHQLGHMQVCTSLQTNNHASTPPLSFFTGRMPFLPPNQQHQSTDGRWLE